MEALSQMPPPAAWPAPVASREEGRAGNNREGRNMAERGYNGWSNYETWNLALWIGNEEGSDGYWRDVTQEVYDDAEADRTFTRVERATLDLADRLKDDITEANPLAGQASFFADVLS